MATFNPDKNLSIEIHSNDLSGCNGYTIWHCIGEERKAAISRRADGPDFEWMTDKQMKDFEAGEYQFKMKASHAIEYYSYIY